MIENNYGKLYLTEEKAKEYINITNKYLRECLNELRKHNICPINFVIDKTEVYTLDCINQLAQEKKSLDKGNVTA